MTLPDWTTPAAAILWQVMLHSLLAAGIFAAWARHLGLPHGGARRRMLEAVLAVPLVTALVPGRGGAGFRDALAWADSSRLLELPLGAGLRVAHLVLAAALLTAVVSLAQEVVPLLRRRPASDPDGVPEALVRQARALPGWGSCRLAATAGQEVFFATGGRPSAPRLLISRGALDRLAAGEMAAVLRHENAHWQRGRWQRTHLLFVLRLLQLHNPVALWAFREHTVETEIACDAEAVAGGDRRTLARVLLRIYDGTPPGDLAARSILRRRVDVLLGRVGSEGEEPSPAAVTAAALLLLVTLPWIV